MEHSPGQTISWVTNQALVNLRKLKSYEVSFPTTTLRDQISITGKKNVKNTNAWRLNNAQLNNQEITEEIKEKIKKYLETNDNENMKTQNLWDAAKAVQEGSLQQYNPTSGNKKKSQINNLTLHLKQLGKEEQKNPKVSRRKEIIKIRSEINKIETKRTIEKINKTKSWFFEKINIINKLLARLIKKEGGF